MPRTKHQVANAQHADYVHWIHSQPCAACGYVGEAIQAAHVGTGGTGLKHGDDDCVIPLCTSRDFGDRDGPIVGCHEQQGQYAGQFTRPKWATRVAWRAFINDWAVIQVAIYRSRFEAAGIMERTRVVPF